jgi:hypothetical protein
LALYLRFDTRKFYKRNEVKTPEEKKAENIKALKANKTRVIIYAVFALIFFSLYLLGIVKSSYLSMIALEIYVLSLSATTIITYYK